MGPNRAHLSVVDAPATTDSEGPGSPDGDAPRSALARDTGGVDDDFVALYTSQYPRLVRALLLGGADRATAEDTAQEAFARTLGHWRRVRLGRNPTGYVYRVAFRLLRRVRRGNLPLEGEVPSPDIATEATLTVGIERALQAMPAARRRCAVLCLVIGVTTKDAARTLRIAESTVRKQIELARRDLRQFLDERP